MANQVYTVPDQYVGKTLGQVRDLTGGSFRPDVLAGFAGIGENTPLPKGNLNINLPDSYLNSGESQGLQKAFGNPLSGDQLSAQANDAATTAALKSAQAIRDFNITSAAPQISTLQSGKTDLSSRYADLLATIKGDQKQATDRATLNTNNELGRRGITGGGVYDTELANSAQQAGQPFEGLYATTATGQTQDLNSIDQQIASLQSGNPAGALSSGLQIGGLSQQASALAAQIAQNQQQNDISKQQLALAQQAQNFQQKYVSVPGYGIFNTGTGQLMGGLNGLTSGSGKIIGTY